MAWLGLGLDGRIDRRGFWEGEERSGKALACLRSFAGASFFSLLQSTVHWPHIADGGFIMLGHIIFIWAKSPRRGPTSTMEWHVKSTPTEGSLVNFRLPL